MATGCDELAALRPPNPKHPAEAELLRSRCRPGRTLTHVGVFLFVLGAALIGFTLVDALWTTIIPHGAGPLTSRVCRCLWFLAKRSPAPIRGHLLPAVGSLSLLAVIIAWVGLLWLGWWTLFSADPASILHGQSQTEANAWSRAYFTGFTLFTLGVGDYVPHGPVWQVATTLASFSGLFLITLSITYLLPVLSAATEKRQLAVMIRDLGRDPTTLVVESWDGQGFDRLTQRLTTTIWPMIHLHVQRHLAYPVLHYFHSNRPGTSLAVGIAVLDEALLVIAHGVAEEARPRPWALAPTLRAIGSMLEVLETRFIRTAAEAPPIPETIGISSAGIPLADAQDFHRSIARATDRRRRLGGLVEDAGWSWRDVRSPATDKISSEPPSK
ncbi:MAG: potassium channel family protein [Chthoniobacterales bacterium]